MSYWELEGKTEGNWCMSCLWTCLFLLPSLPQVFVTDTATVKAYHCNLAMPLQLIIFAVRTHPT